MYTKKNVAGKYPKIWDAIITNLAPDKNLKMNASRAVIVAIYLLIWESLHSGKSLFFPKLL